MPSDRYHAIYFAMLLAGVGFLLPYNSFITDVDYLHHKYPGGSPQPRPAVTGCPAPSAPAPPVSRTCSGSPFYSNPGSAANGHRVSLTLWAECGGSPWSGQAQRTGSPEHLPLAGPSQGHQLCST